QSMGNDYPANQYGLSSIGLHYVYGRWLRWRFVGFPLARRLLVCYPGKASASSALYSDFSSSDCYVLAGRLYQNIGLRPLFNFFSPPASNLDGGGNRLACEVCTDTKNSYDRGMGLGDNPCYVLEAIHRYGVSRQETMAARRDS